MSEGKSVRSKKRGEAGDDGSAKFRMLHCAEKVQYLARERFVWSEAIISRKISSVNKSIEGCFS